MAAIELGSLSDHLSEEELVELSNALKTVEAPALPDEDGEGAVIAKRLDDVVLDEFIDRLDGEDIAGEVYLPIEFDGVVEVGDRRYASASVLLDVLEALKDDLGIEEEVAADADDEEDEDEDDDDEPDGFADISLVDKAMREMWRYYKDGAQAAIDRGLAMIVKRT